MERHLTRCRSDHVPGISHIDEAPISAMLQPAILDAIIGARGFWVSQHRFSELDISNLNRSRSRYMADIKDMDIAVRRIDHIYFFFIGRERDAVAWSAGAAAIPGE